MLDPVGIFRASLRISRRCATRVVEFSLGVRAPPAAHSLPRNLASTFPSSPRPAKPARCTPFAPSRYPLSFPCLFARILLTHPLPSLASLAGARRTVARAAPALRTVALATLWVPSHVCGRIGHVLCEGDAHALCLVVMRACGAEQFACRVVHPCMLMPRLPVPASRCGCMLSSHICELVHDITSISYVH